MVDIFRISYQNDAGSNAFFSDYEAIAIDSLKAKNFNNNILFHTAMTINSRTFNDVYEFKSVSRTSNNRTYPERIYYNKALGIVGFYFSDTSIYALQQ